MAKSWEPTFLIRDFGFYEELSTKVGFAFSNNGLKLQDLQFGMEKNYMNFLIMFHDFIFDLDLDLDLDHLTYHCPKCLFHTQNCIIE